MPLYGGIARHANTRVIVWLNAQDEVIYRNRLSNDLPTILEPFAPYHTEMKGLVVGVFAYPLEKVYSHGPEWICLWAEWSYDR
jgi:hypothetical protein